MDYLRIGRIQVRNLFARDTLLTCECPPSKTKMFLRYIYIYVYICLYMPYIWMHINMLFSKRLVMIFDNIVRSYVIYFHCMFMM